MKNIPAGLAMLILTVTCTSCFAIMPIWHARMVHKPDSDMSAQTYYDESQFVQPFFVHEALPAQPDQLDLRTLAYRERLGQVASADYAFNIEAGLVKDLGLTVRNEGEINQKFSELMALYKLLGNNNRGMGVLAEALVPTGGGPDPNDARAAVGASGRTILLDNRAKVDSNVRYNPRDQILYFEGAVVWKANKKLFPVFEVNGTMNAGTDWYVLPGLKYRIDQRSALGFGLQIGMSDIRAFDNRGILSYEISFLP
jgi:hypothetical protein